MGRYTSLDALKSYGGFENDSEDVLLDGLIGSASAIIDDTTHRKFSASSETDQSFTRVRGASTRFSGRTLYFFEDLAVEASAITDSPTVIYLPENGAPYYGCYLTEGSWNDTTVTVTGYWAYSKVAPPAIEIACLKLSKWLYDQKDSGNTDAVMFTPEGRVILPSGLPADVMAILQPYIKVVFA